MKDPRSRFALHALIAILVSMLVLSATVTMASAETNDIEDGLVQKAIAFTDVPEDHWASGVIRRAVKLGLFSGYAGECAGQFGPEDGLTRAQAVTVLWRMAGSPDLGRTAPFSDVAEDAYYARAVAWAASRRVVSGYGGERSGLFGPGDPVTREQLAAMLANYAGKIGGLRVSGSARSYAAMSDADSVAAWAESSVGWCYACGLMSGGSGLALPQGGATRAQAAKMMVILYDRVSSPWQLSVSASTEAVRTGSRVSMYPSISGDAEGLSYSYRVACGSWSAKVQSGELILSEAGACLLSVTARDVQGRSQTASCVVDSYELRELSASWLGGSRWRASADVGVRGGRVAGLEYRFTYTRSGSTRELRGWASDSSCEFDVSNIGGAASAIELAVEARDASGSLGRATHTLSEEKLRYPKKWVLLGDSLTEKTYSAKTAYYDYVAQDINCKVANYGKSGTGYKEPCYNEPFYQRVDMMDLSNADCVTVFGSFNDLEKGYTLGAASDTTTATIGGCMNLTIQKLKAKNPSLKIGIVTPTPWRTNYGPSGRDEWPYAITREECDEYVALLKAVAKRHGLPVLDLYEDFPVDPNDPEVRRRYYTEDGILDDAGVHPNSEGHKLMYPLWREFVLDLMG